MTLSAIASPERAENLIYTVLPFSIGLWMLGFFADLQHIGEWLAVLGLITSLGALVLYEIGFEEYLFNALLKRWSTTSERNPQATFLKWNLLVKTWVKSLEEPPKLEESHTGWFERFQSKLRGKEPSPGDEQSPYLRAQVALVAEKTVSSNPIKRRVWRIRGFFYLVPSFFLLWVVGVETLTRVPITVFPDWLALPLDIFLTSLLWQFCVLLVILGLMVAINRHRHKDLVDHIQYLTEFNYLQILIAVDSIKNPGRYEDRAEMAPIKRELESLNEMLLRGYWSMFASTWSRVKKTLETEAAEKFRRDSVHTVRVLWGDFIQSSRRNADVESDRRELGWFIHFAYAGRSMLKGFAKKIIETHLAAAYQRSTSLEDVAKPDVILDMMLEKSISEDQFEELAMIIAQILMRSYTNLDHSMTVLVDELTKGDMSDFDDQKTGRVVRRYLLEMADDRKITSFWQQVGSKGLKVTVERLPNPDDRQFAIRTFLDAASDSAVIESLDYDIWTEALHDAETFKQLKTRVKNPRDINDMPDQANEKLNRYGIDLG